MEYRRRPILIIVSIITILVLIFYFSSKSSSSEKTPFLLPTLVTPAPSVTTEKIESFESSVENHLSAENSNEDMGKKKEAELLSQQITQDQLNQCLQFGATADKRSYDLLTADDWKVEKVTSHGDTVSYRSFPETGGKIFKITGTLNIDAATLINKFYAEFDTIPSWYEDIAESKLIHKIDGSTELFYQSTPTLSAGAISPRDMVLIRHLGQYEPYHIITAHSADFIEIPERDDYVRARNDFTCHAARSLAENKCEYTFMSSLNLKGWLPNYIVQMFLPNTMPDFIKAMRKHFSA